MSDTTPNATEAKACCRGRSPIESGALTVLRLGIGAVFLFSAYNKLIDLQEFSGSVKAFELFPEHADHLVVMATFVVPWLEAICGAALVLGFWSRAAATVSSVLLVAFIGAIISVLARHMSVDCGCFGRLRLLCPKGPLGACNIGQNTLLLVGSLWIAISGPGFLAIDNACRTGCCRRD